MSLSCVKFFFFFFQAEYGIRCRTVTGVQTCALPILVTVGQTRADDAAADAIRLALTPPAGPVIALLDDSIASHRAGSGRPARNGAAGVSGTRALGLAGAAAGGKGLAVLAEALRSSRRPVVLLGAAAISHTTAIRAALNGSAIPVLHTSRARGKIE